jgi:glycosyltransferase involved in cell wall biosynthesis
VDFFSFAVSGFLAGLFRPADIIVATSPQLLSALAGCSLAIVRRRPWIFEVRDLWPDSIVAVGVMRENLFIRLLQKLETWLYRRANRIVAVSDGIRDRLIARGVPAEKIGVVPNGVNLGRTAAAIGGADEKGALRLEGRFVVGYVGTHGMAQGLEVALGAAQALRDSKVHFLFVGDGARRDALITRAEEMQLDNVTFIGLVPLEEAAAYLSACDAVLIPLKRTSQIEITLPGKIFEAAAMGKPILVSAEGASADLVRRYGAGVVTPPEDSAALAGAIRRLMAEPELRDQLSRGSVALSRDFDRERFANMMLAELRTAMSS